MQSERSRDMSARPEHIAQLPCPECGKLMEITRSRFKEQNWWYRCPDWPHCRGSHSADPQGKPTGSPADAETRKLRHRCHELFDAIYMRHENKKIRKHMRMKAIFWLCDQLEIAAKECHFGKFTKEQCLQTIELLERLEINPQENRDVKI